MMNIMSRQFRLEVAHSRILLCNVRLIAYFQYYRDPVADMSSFITTLFTFTGNRTTRRKLKRNN